MLRGFAHAVGGSGEFFRRVHGQHHIAAGEPGGKIRLLCRQRALGCQRFKFQFDLPRREGKQLPGPFDPGLCRPQDDLPRSFIQAPVISSIAA